MKPIELLYLLLPAGIFGGELALKNRMEKWPFGKENSILKGRILVRHYDNHGAAFNAGEKKPWLVRLLSVLLTAVVAVVFAVTLTTRGNHALKTGLALLLGGAFSNTYDRLKRKYVVDYFSFPVKWKPLQRLVFNLSDFCILIGALMAAISAE